MFASRDRGSVKSGRSAGDSGSIKSAKSAVDRPATPQSNGGSTPVKQNADAPHADSAASTPSKQTSATPQPNVSRSTSSHIASTNGTSGTSSTSSSQASDISILAKSTDDVYNKYQKQLNSMVNLQNLYSESLESFLDFIAADRLRRVPHQGSRWDKILRMAEHTAIRIAHYQEAVEGIFAKSKEAAHIIWGSCRVLIQVSLPTSRALTLLTSSRWVLNMPSS